MTSILLGFRLAAASTVILHAVGIVQNNRVGQFGMIMTFLLTLWFHLRNSHGLDGSDQMTVICLTAVLLSRLAPTNATVATACLWFIALQSLLAYLTSGVAEIDFGAVAKWNGN